jgi:hypothetical protein
MKAKIVPISLTVLVAAISFIIGRISGSSSSTSQDLNASPTSSTRPSSGSGQASFTSESNRSSTSSRAHTGSAASRSASVADPMDRWQKINEIQDPLERTRQWMQLVNSLAPEQFKKFVPGFLDEALAEHEDEYEILVAAWARVNPVAAIDYASKSIDSLFECNTILATWASNDPDSAIAWAKSNHTGNGANSFMIGVIKGLAAHNPVRATALINEMPAARERGEALDSLLPTIMKRGISERRDWVDAITNPSLREEAMMRVAESNASEDPQGTIDWLVANPSGATGRSIDDVICAIASEDSNAAISYFNSLPAGLTRASALRGIIYAVASENPKLAASLIDNHNGDLTDRTVEEFVSSSLDADPQGAVSRIALIKDAEEQESVYNVSLEKWVLNDQQAAIDWVNSNTLPPNVVDRLNRNLQSQPDISN